MSGDAVYRKIARPDPRLVARAAACAMSDLYEAMDANRRDAALMRPAMRPLVAGLRIAGPAVTARCAPRDNLMMHRALLLVRVIPVMGSFFGWNDCGASQHEGIHPSCATKHGLFRIDGKMPFD